MHAVFWLETFKGREYSEEVGVSGEIILDWILGKYDGKVWTGFIWLRLRTSDGLL
jgi:hypothetical protein